MVTGAFRTIRVESADAGGSNIVVYNEREQFVSSVYQPDPALVWRDWWAECRRLQAEWTRMELGAPLGDVIFTGPRLRHT